MGILPKFNIVLENQINNATTSTEKLGRSFLFDFNKGEFVLHDGKLVEVEGIESLKVWIEKVIKTEKFKFKIYETGEKSEYGITLLDLITKNYPQYFVQAEIQREITEALARNTEILSVENFNFSREKRKLIVNFNVNSIHGSTMQEVKF